MPKSCDVIVIGSGIGGLTAALLLARRGLKVIVFEAHDRPGGAATSWVRKARDKNRIARRFIFDAGVQDISGLAPGAPLARLLEGTEAGAMLQWQRVRHRYIQDGLCIDVPETRQGFEALLAIRFPQERCGIERLFAEIAHLETEIASNTERLLSGQGDMGDLSAWAVANPAMMRWMKEPYDAFLGHFISDPALKQLLTIISEYVTEDPARLTVGDMVPLFGYYRHGGFYPRGGTQQLSNALMHDIRSHGGIVRLKTQVAKIRLEGERVVGVTTIKGEEIAAREVIANMDPASCHRDLLGSPVLPANYNRRLKAREQGPSGILVSIGLDTLPDLPARTFVHANNMGLGIGNPSAIDTTLAPPGHAAITLLHLISAEKTQEWLALSGAAYETAKSEITDTLLDLATIAIPDLRRHIVHHETATPRTFLSYLNTPHGEIYGTAIGQWAPRAATPIPGLTLTGATTHYGPGVEAAVLSGFEAANQLA